MKKTIGSFSLIVLLLVGSCGLINKLGQFYVDYNEQVTFAPQLPVNVPITVYSPPINTNIEQTLQANNTNPKLVKSVKLNQLTLTITSPQGQTFTFLQNISAYISTDSLPEVEIASKQSIPDTVGAQLSLDINNVELKNYLLSNQVKLRITCADKQMLGQQVTVNIYSKFFVQANLLAAL